MSLNPIERSNLLTEIGLKLQADKTTYEINLFLGGYGIETESVTIVPSKRVYVTDLLKYQSDKLIIQVASDLKIPLPRKDFHSTDHFQVLLEINQLHSVIDDFNRAFRNLELDPEAAIASASSTLESICKSILDKFEEAYPTAQSMQPLIRKVYQRLNLSPDQHANSEIKKILGGLSSVATGIGTLRTKNSSAHGHGSKKKKLSVRHSRLVVNSCMTIGIFLLETYYEKHIVE